MARLEGGVALPDLDVLLKINMGINILSVSLSSSGFLGFSCLQVTNNVRKKLSIM